MKLISFVLHFVYIGGYSGGQLGVRPDLHAYFVNNLHERGGRSRRYGGFRGGEGARGERATRARQDLMVSALPAHWRYPHLAEDNHRYDLAALQIATVS